MALNHTTPTDRSATARVPNGMTSVESTAATGTLTTPARHSSRSGAGQTPRLRNQRPRHREQRPHRGGRG